MLALTVILGVLAFIIGASVGSFLNLAADRVPAGRSIITPRSFCEAWGRLADAEIVLCSDDV